MEGPRSNALIYRREDASADDCAPGSTAPSLWSSNMRVRFSSAVRAVLVAVLLATVTGCTSSAPDARLRSRLLISYTRGLPPGVVLAPSPSQVPAVSWAEPGRRVYVTTFGSGSCPELPQRISAQGRHRVSITTATRLPANDEVCTLDLAPTTSTVTVPPGIDVSISVDVEVDGKTVRLPPA